MPGAFVNQSSVHWLPPPENVKSYVMNFTYDTRQLLLDDLYFNNAVLTAYQFYYQESLKFFAMRIFGKNIIGTDFGTLDEEEIKKTNYGINLAVLKNLETKIPGLLHPKEGFTVTFGNSSTIIKFGASNQRVDAGQTYVPYFDGADTTFEVESPLSGIGLIHYTNDIEFAGYIRPYLRSYKYGKIIAYYEKNLKTIQNEAQLRHGYRDV